MLQAACALATRRYKNIFKGNSAPTTTHKNKTISIVHHLRCTTCYHFAKIHVNRLPLDLVPMNTLDYNKHLDSTKTQNNKISVAEKSELNASPDTNLKFVRQYAIFTYSVRALFHVS